MFDTILMPTDGSNYAQDAARYGADVARKYSSAVTLLYVVELPPAIGLAPEANRHEEMRLDMSKHGREALDVTREIFEAAGVIVETELVYGSAVPTILRYARDGAFDLLVMGSRGAGTTAVDQILIGSVAEGILHSAPCPILMIRPTAAGRAGESTSR